MGGEAFGARLREVRGRLTQDAVARRSVLGRAALTRQRVSNIENGLLPSAEQLRCYLHGCGKPELFEELEQARAALEPVPEKKTPASGVRPRHLALVAGAVGLVALTVVAVSALTGPATVVIPECAPGTICFWPEPDFGGAMIQWPPDWEQDGRQCVTLPFIARSVMNASTERQRGYASGDCTDKQRSTLLQHNNGQHRSVIVGSYIKT